MFDVDAPVSAEFSHFNHSLVHLSDPEIASLSRMPSSSRFHEPPYGSSSTSSQPQTINLAKTKMACVPALDLK